MIRVEEYLLLTVKTIACTLTDKSGVTLDTYTLKTGMPEPSKLRFQLLMRK
jgi:hypothetical protein